MSELKYQINPKNCLFCKKQLPYSKRFNKYCNSSCAATSNNQKRVLNNHCLNCDKPISKRNNRKYCSTKCQHERLYNERIYDWLNGKIEGGNNQGIRTWARRYLFAEQNGECTICGLSKWLGKPIGLIADHIDGNPLNHVRSNLRLICANCDMQLDTYKAKNKGSGRAWRLGLTVKQDSSQKTNLKKVCKCGNAKDSQAQVCQKCFVNNRKSLSPIDWPGLKELETKYKEVNCNMTALGKELKCSDNAIRKHLQNQHGVCFIKKPKIC